VTTAITEPLAQEDQAPEEATVGCTVCGSCYPESPSFGQELVTLCGKAEAWFEWEEMLPDCPDCTKVTRCVNGHNPWL
jgi:hypothetical protein